MKKTYKLKKEVAKSLRKLFNGRAVEKAEEEWNNRPRVDSGLGFEKLCINLVRIQCEYGDWVTFTSNDFEEIVEYDPDGWNVFPECSPTPDEDLKHFIVYDPSFDDIFLLRWNNYLGSFDYVYCDGTFETEKNQFYFKKITLPEQEKA